MPIEMVNLAEGGAKGEPGKIPRAAFEGARTVTKATRTLWLVALRQYNRHAMLPFLKIPIKTIVTEQLGLESVNSRGQWCLPGTTPVAYFRLARSTIRSRVRTAIPVGPFDL